MSDRRSRVEQLLPVLLQAPSPRAGYQATSRRAGQRAAHFEFSVSIGGEHQKASVPQSSAQVLEQEKSGTVRPLEVVKAQQQTTFSFARDCSDEIGKTVEKSVALAFGFEPSTCCEVRQLVGDFWQNVGHFWCAFAKLRPQVVHSTGPNVFV